MTRKAEKRARKKERSKEARSRIVCDDCGFAMANNEGDHDTAYSANGVTWEGIAVVAWCPSCGCDTGTVQ